MAFDPDLVRVDLLKCKRKLFLSYPEGSKERKDFLYSTKLSELGYLSKLVPPEVADLVFEEYDKLRKYDLISFGIRLGIGAVLTAILFGLHHMHPTNAVLQFWFLPFWLGLSLSFRYILHMIEGWKKVRPFKKEYQELQSRIHKLKNELEDFIK